jgi:hypothetical protein
MFKSLRNLMRSKVQEFKVQWFKKRGLVEIALSLRMTSVICLVLSVRNQH